MPEQPQAVIYDAIRTPRGKGKANGALHEVKPIDLLVGLIDAVRERNPGLDPAQIDDVVLLRYALSVRFEQDDQGGTTR